MSLTNEQKEFIDKNFHEIPDLIALTRATFKDGTIDGRSKQGREVRGYLASKDIKYKTTKKPISKPIVRNCERYLVILTWVKVAMANPKAKNGILLSVHTESLFTTNEKRARKGQSISISEEVASLVHYWLLKPYPFIEMKGFMPKKQFHNGLKMKDGINKLSQLTNTPI